MPDAYDLPESRFLQKREYVGAADATYVASGAVPAGKIWTILSASYAPSATETKIVQYQIGGAGYNIAVTRPESWVFTAGAGSFWPLVTEGMEIKLFPGESLIVNRESATAGSHMHLLTRYIESDMPLYEYTEPQVRLRQAHALSTVRSVIGAAAAGSRGGGVPGPGEAGGGRRSLPK